MELVHTKCPNCGAEIQLDESKENGFCLYCGSSVIFKEGLSCGTIIVNGVEISHDTSKDIINIAKSGKKIKAIKLLYDSTGSELAHSKAYIELLMLNDYNIGITNQEYKKGNTTGANKSGCYIATAVYGSYDAYEVRILRKFRDEALAKTIFGRLLINVYYYLSPSVSQQLNKSESVSYLFRRCIDKVVVRLQNVYKE